MLDSVFILSNSIFISSHSRVLNTFLMGSWFDKNSINMLFFCIVNVLFNKEGGKMIEVILIFAAIGGVLGLLFSSEKLTGLIMGAIIGAGTPYIILALFWICALIFGAISLAIEFIILPFINFWPFLWNKLFGWIPRWIFTIFGSLAVVIALIVIFIKGSGGSGGGNGGGISSANRHNIG